MIAKLPLLIAVMVFIITLGIAGTAASCVGNDCLGLQTTSYYLSLPLVALVRAFPYFSRFITVGPWALPIASATVNAVCVFAILSIAAIRTVKRTPRSTITIRQKDWWF